jgi:hypothetical protein
MLNIFVGYWFFVFLRWNNKKYNCRGKIYPELRFTITLASGDARERGKYWGIRAAGQLRYTHMFRIKICKKLNHLLMS